MNYSSGINTIDDDEYSTTPLPLTSNDDVDHVFVDIADPTINVDNRNEDDEDNFDDGDFVWSTPYVIPECDANDDVLDRARSISNALDPYLIPLQTPSVACLTLMDRRELLQQYFPAEVVDYYIHTFSQHNELVEALQKVPYLVMEETPLEQYVLRHNQASIKEGGGGAAAVAEDCWNSPSHLVVARREGAIKIAMHWKLRKYFFGPKRAFLPMTMTITKRSTSIRTSDSDAGRSTTQQQEPTMMMQGALSEKDMEWFNSAFMVLLPNETDVVHGALVVATDRSRFPDDYLPADPNEPGGSTNYDNMAIRCAFYTCQLISQHTTLEMIEPFMVAAIQEKTPPSPYYVSWCLFLVENAFPVRLREHHFVHLPSKQRQWELSTNPQQQQQRKRQSNSSSSSFLTSAVNHSKRILGEARRLMVGYRFSFGYTDAQVLQKMCQAKGFNPNYFPTWMGGKWTQHDFEQWKEQQLQIEQERHAKYVVLSEQNKKHKEQHFQQLIQVQQQQLEQEDSEDVEYPLCDEDLGLIKGIDEDYGSKEGYQWKQDNSHWNGTITSLGHVSYQEHHNTVVNLFDLPEDGEYDHNDITSTLLMMCNHDIEAEAGRPRQRKKIYLEDFGTQEQKRDNEEGNCGKQLPQLLVPKYGDIVPTDTFAEIHLADKDLGMFELKELDFSKGL